MEDRHMMEPEPESEPQQYYYALRKGRSSQRCIYIYKQDLLAQITRTPLNGNNEDSDSNPPNPMDIEYQYQIFDSMEEALCYIRRDDDRDGDWNANANGNANDAQQQQVNNTAVTYTNTDVAVAVEVDVDLDVQGVQEDVRNINTTAIAASSARTTEELSMVEEQQQQQEREDHGDGHGENIDFHLDDSFDHHHEHFENDDNNNDDNDDDDLQPDMGTEMQLQQEHDEESESSNADESRQPQVQVQPPPMSDEEEWELRYVELVQYHAKYGTSDVPTHMIPLGNWVARQRTEYSSYIRHVKGKNNIHSHNWPLLQEREGQDHPHHQSMSTAATSTSTSTTNSILTEEKIQRLQNIQFCFGGHLNRKTFENYVQELIQYRQHNQGLENLNPPNGSMLHRWVVNMKKKYKEYKKKKRRLTMEMEQREQGGVGVGVGVGMNASTSSSSRVMVSGIDAEKCLVLERLGFSWTDNHGNSGDADGGGGNGDNDAVENTTTTTTGTTASRQSGSTQQPRDVTVGDMADGTMHDEMAVDENDTIARSTSTRITTNANGTIPLLPSPPVPQEPPLPPPPSNVNPPTDDVSEEASTRSIPTSSSTTATPTATSNKPKRKPYTRKRPRKEINIMTEDVWNEMYDELVKFKEKHGHCIVPVQPVSQLRKYVDRQRIEYRRIKEGDASLLTTQRMQKLSSIGFHFEKKVRTKTFEERVEELQRFKANFGHCKVPRLFNQPSYEGLGKWIAEQRVKRNHMLKGKRSTMTPEKERLLTKMGMIWSVFKLPPKEERAERKPWSGRFQELLEFKERHGHTIVPQAYPALGHWVHTQRVNYKLMKQGRKSPMTRQQALQLQEIDFVFEVMPRKQQVIRQSLGNPFPHLPLIESKNDDPVTAQQQQAAATTTSARGTDIAAPREQRESEVGEENVIPIGATFAEAKDDGDMFI